MICPLFSPFQVYILKFCDIPHLPYACYVLRSCQSFLSLTSYSYFMQNTKHVVCNCIHILVTSPILDPNILFNIPSRGTLNLSSALGVREKVLCTHFEPTKTHWNFTVISGVWLGIAGTISRKFRHRNKRCYYSLSCFNVLILTDCNRWKDVICGLIQGSVTAHMQRQIVEC
jgi:hypothetical protein